jgi:hypothetical protein
MPSPGCIVEAKECPGKVDSTSKYPALLYQTGFSIYPLFRQITSPQPLNYLILNLLLKPADIFVNIDSNQQCLALFEP